MLREDKCFVEIPSSYKKPEDGRCEIPLPVKEESLKELECKLDLAEQRLN